MPLTRTLQTAVLLALLTLSAGCQTTIGNYLGNRAQDLSDCFLIETGVGIGLGVDVKAGGLVHANLFMNVWMGRLGWVYGDHGVVGKFEIEFGIPAAIPSSGFLHMSSLGTRAGKVWHSCYALLPGLWSWEGRAGQKKSWIWASRVPSGVDVADSVASRARDRGDRARRWSRVHAFDFEVGVHALLVGARVGFSPGEFLDFILGWFGVDIACDDSPVHPPPEEAEPSGERPSAEGPPAEEPDDEERKP